MKKFFFSLMTSAYLVLPMLAMAQLPGQVNSSGQVVVQDERALLSLIDRIIAFFRVFVLTIAVGAILYSAFLFVSANWLGNGKTEDARKILTYAIIGIIVALLSYSVIPVIRSFFGVR